MHASTIARLSVLMLTAGLAMAQPATTAPAAAPAAKTAEAQTAKPAMPEPGTLLVGDKAPELKVEKWVKGAAVTGFEKGKVYVVEFWATWCGPCIAGMPHLSELQKEYKDKGVTIIGMTSKDPRNSLEAVEKMVSEKGDTMGYTVAWDMNRETNGAYMMAAAQTGIPCAFIVDGEGRIAWVGHPMLMDETLDKVVKGTWDIKKARSEFEKEIKSDAAMIKFYSSIRSKDEAKTIEFGKAVLEHSGDNAERLNELAWTIVDPAGPLKATGTTDLTTLAFDAATKANDESGGKDPAILDTLARVHWVKGEKDKAIEIQTKAVENATGDMLGELKKTLEEYTAGTN